MAKIIFEGKVPEWAESWICVESREIDEFLGFSPFKSIEDLHTSPVDFDLIPVRCRCNARFTEFVIMGNGNGGQSQDFKTPYTCDEEEPECPIGYKAVCHENDNHWWCEYDPD